MIIRKIYISSFGKLKNFSFNPSDGFNVIKENNGWGKTTLAAFIKSIFYGLDNGRKSLSASERKKYKPWNSTEKFGGYIEFTWANNEYKIERYFGDKESDDTVRLFDLKTGKESFKTENLGKRLFSIDEEGFDSSVYFSQKDLEGDVSTGLIEKFNSSYSKENDDFDKAYSRVEQTLKEYKIRGDKGKIPLLKQKIFAINEEISVAKKAKETYFIVEKQVKNLKDECEKLKKDIDVISYKIESAGSAEAIKVKKERFNACVKHLNALKSELNKKEKFFLKGIPSDKELEGYDNCNKELAELKEKINSIKTAQFYIENTNKASDSKKKNNSVLYLFAALSVIFAGLGIFFVFHIPILGIAFFAAAATLIVLGLFISYHKIKSDFEKPPADISVYKKLELSEYEKIAAVYEKKLNEFFSGFAFSEDVSLYQDKFSAVKIALSDIARISAYIKEAENEYELLRKDPDVFVKDIMPVDNLNELKEKAAFMRNEYAVKTRELAIRNSDLKTLDESASKLSDFENALQNVKEDLKNAENEFIILSETKEYLSYANDNIIGKYRAPMEESFRKYLSLIDKNIDYYGIIDVDLKLTIKDGEITRDTAYYSEGYKNLFEICKRFAFIDVLFTGEKPFILLDDPFTNLDKDKITAGVDLLNKISAEYQIFYFICHDSRGLSE